MFRSVQPSGLNRYRILRRLGRGGMGEVLLAEDTALDRRVALKILSDERARDENQRKRFRAEAKAASGLSHPNVCVIHEVGETEDGRPFLAMEYVEGETLDTILQKRRLRLHEIVGVGIQVAQALAAAHSRRIMHRDIKPSNIIIDGEGRVKVLDFGLAKQFGQHDLSASTVMSHTQTGMLVGTPHYMSPEQALGHQVDHRTDIFSLGVVLYEAVAGQKPFLGRTVGETINNVVNQRPEPPASDHSGSFPVLDRIILRCLEKNPADRYESARSLLEDLRRWKLDAEREATPASPSVVPPASAVATVVPGEGARSAGLFNWPLAVAAVLIAAMALTAVLIVSGTREQSSGTSGQPASVAVLPLDNFSGESDTDYLSDGLTEEITTALCKVPGLKVAARNSAFAFKGRKQSAQAMAKALGVNTLLEGSVRKSGNQLRVTVQLINAADGFHLWSETYDRKVDDLLSVQQDIARSIVERLQVPGAAGALASQSVDTETHRLYLMARQHWNRRTEASLKEAIRLFREAIDRDPTYVAAQSGLSATYVLLPLYSMTAKPSEYHPLARAAALRALELDPRSAEALTVLGQLESHARNDQAAEEHFRKAIEFAPNYPTAYHWYGRHLNLRNRRDEGLDQLKKAMELDPLSPVIQATFPEWFLIGGDYERADVEIRKVIEKFPEFSLARGLLAAVLVKQERYEEALAEIERARAMLPEQPSALLDLRGFVLARLGREEEARKILGSFQQELQQGKPVQGSIAVLHLGLREYDRAITALEEFCQSPDTDPTMLCDRIFSELRDFPRYADLLARHGVHRPVATN